MKAKWFSMFLILGLLVIAFAPAASAAPAASVNEGVDLVPKNGNQPDPLTTT
jgi:hypothetical protein